MDGVIERLPHVYFEKEALLTRDRGAAPASRFIS
jgi:hypothetical protein